MIRRCGACDRDNRVAPRHLARTGRCGACQATLGPLAEPIDVDAATFDDIIANAKVPVLVDFWAPWCGPCRMVAPEVKRAAARVMGKALVLKVNTEAVPALGERYRVTSIPTFAVFSGGRLVSQQAGAMNHERLLAFLAIARTAA